MRIIKSMTERQVQILAAIIEQYAEIASPVGSVTLAKLLVYRAQLYAPKWLS